MNRNLCPECGGNVRLEPSINFFVCKKCCETLYASDLVRACDREFGKDHEHDDAECARMLAVMSDGYGDPNEFEREAYNREAEEQMLGRPLFPNEY